MEAVDDDDDDAENFVLYIITTYITTGTNVRFWSFVCLFVMFYLFIYWNWLPIAWRCTVVG